jgi:hypothetical protein
MSTTISVWIGKRFSGAPISEVKISKHVIWITAKDDTEINMYFDSSEELLEFLDKLLCALEEEKL